MTAFRRLYGDGPGHLLATAGCLVVAGYVVVSLVPDPSAPWILVWFLGGVVVHDLVLFPLYAAADRLLLAFRRRDARTTPTRASRISVTNHIRIPAMGSGLLLLIFLPSITRHSGDAFTGTSGQSLDAALPNWLAITALLALVSGVAYAVRWVLDRRRTPAAGRPGG